MASARSSRTAVFRALPIAGILALALAPRDLTAQGNGKLQIHFMDVGQGDGAVLISPKGEVVLFDDGVLHNCDKPIAYLQQLGITGIDYHVTSHYHADHIGCVAAVLHEYPLKKKAFDRGDLPGSVAQGNALYATYLQTVGALRAKAVTGTALTLDAGGASPVTITFVAEDGQPAGGPAIPTNNENDLSLVSVVDFGAFRAEMGGDLSGDNTATYADIETSVAPLVGRVDVYKVHHHCSSHSSNDAWLGTIKPRIGIISTGNGNTYGHPAPDCLDRLHAAGVRTYWTEKGNGGSPALPNDVVSGSVFVEVSPGAPTYSVTTAGGNVDSFPLWAAPSSPAGPTPAVPISSGSFAWSRLSKVYHDARCSYVASILPSNLERGTAPPPGKQLHSGCPR